MTAGPGDEQPEDDLLQQMLEDARVEAGRATPATATAPVVDPFLTGRLPDETKKSAREALLAEIDLLVSAQVDEILAQPEVQRLRLAWEGLAELVEHIDFDENVRLELLNCSKEDLSEDFRGATSVTDSGLYRRLCDKELSLEGERYSPVSLIVTDYSFDHHQDEIEILSHCAAVAADAHAPFISNTSPRFFGCEGFSDLPASSDMRRILEGPRYAAWQSFRNGEDARYVALCVPGVSRALAIRVAQSFAKYRGFGGLSGEGCCPVDGLQATEHVERDLIAGGFTVLAEREGIAPKFSSVRSTHLPKRFADTPEGRAAAIDNQASAELANVLTISRLAHFVEAIAIERLPGVEASDLERVLQQWLVHYAAEVPSAEEADTAVTEPGYLRYELTVRRAEGGSSATLLVAGRLD